MKSETREKYQMVIEEMKLSIIECLATAENGYGLRKWFISKQTGITIDVLTVLLKQLKHDGKVELIMIWSEITGKPDGSGYCLKGKLNLS